MPTICPVPGLREYFCVYARVCKFTIDHETVSNSILHRSDDDDESSESVCLSPSRPRFFLYSNSISDFAFFGLKFKPDDEDPEDEMDIPRSCVMRVFSAGRKSCCCGSTAAVVASYYSSR